MTFVRIANREVVMIVERLRTHDSLCYRRHEGVCVSVSSVWSCVEELPERCASVCFCLRAAARLLATK